MSTFWKLSILLTVIGSAYSGVQYYRNVDKAGTDVALLQGQLAQSQVFMQQRKAEWGKIEELQAKAMLAYAKKPALLQQKDELEKKFRLFEGDFKYLVKSTREAVDKARATAVDQVYPEIKLTDGRVLKDAKIRKAEERQISFIHSGGIGTIPYEQLPESLRTKFDMGNNGLAFALATTERNIFSPGGQQEFEGLSLRCPYVLASNSNIPASLKGSQVIKSVQFYGHKTADIEINLMSIHYVDGFALNLQDSYAGSMKAISSLEGVTNPVQKVEDLNISGIPAKRVSFTANRFGDVLCMESIYIIRGQHLWTVLTTFTDKNKESRPTVNSMLSSIALQASP